MASLATTWTGRGAVAWRNAPARTPSLRQTMSSGPAVPTWWAPCGRIW